MYHLIFKKLEEVLDNYLYEFIALTILLTFFGVAIVTTETIKYLVEIALIK